MSQDANSIENTSILGQDKYPSAEVVYTYWIKQNNSCQGQQKPRYVISYEPSPGLSEDFILQYKKQLADLGHLISSIDEIVDKTGVRDTVGLAIKAIKLIDKARAEVEMSYVNRDAITGYLMEVALKKNEWTVESITPLWVACCG